MKKILLITPFLLALVFAAVPVSVEAQTMGLTEAQKLAQIASQLEEIEEQVNYLTLLVTKVALERQAANLERQLAAMIPSEQTIAISPAALEKGGLPAKVGKETAAFPQAGGEDLFSQPSSPKAADAKEMSGFVAALGPLGNLGTPELAALVILALLAMFVLARRFRSRTQEPIASQGFPEPKPTQQDLLQEGRQDLKENIAWK